MFSVPTLLIVGAGASVEVGFPTGPALKQRIIEALTFQHDGWQFQGGAADIRRSFQFAASDEICSLNQLLDASDHIVRNLPLTDSIDSFLHSHQGQPAIELSAKIAICEIISRYETASSLYIEHSEQAQNFNFAPLSETWLARLWAKIHQNMLGQSLSSIFTNLEIITFNYDRCIEQFLSLALSSFYRVNLSEARLAVDKLDITHVYGSLGALRSGEPNHGEFGVVASSLIAPSARIKTFTESVDSRVLDASYKKIVRSQRVIFLGFSFAGINMDFLRLARGDDNAFRSVRGTCYRMSDENIDAATRGVESLFCKDASAARLVNDTCVNFFDRLSLSL
jgi:hypothetical protein